MKKKVNELLIEKAELFKSKGEEYGNTYEQFGIVMKTLFPEALTILTTEDWNRFGIYAMLVHKMLRISKKIFQSDISIDSIQDIQVYGAMLEELCQKKQEE